MWNVLPLNDAPQDVQFLGRNIENYSPVMAWCMTGSNKSTNKNFHCDTGNKNTHHELSNQEISEPMGDNASTRYNLPYDLNIDHIIHGTK